MQIQPYVFFDGRCEEALEFYQQSVGAEIGMLLRYRDNPDPSTNPPGAEDNIMHGEMRIGESTVLVSDGHCGGSPTFEGFALTLIAKSVEESERLYKALEEGGQVLVPLGKSFFSPSFGMLTDQFGVMWLVYVVP